jgi:hypothetical protein
MLTLGALVVDFGSLYVKAGHAQTLSTPPPLQQASCSPYRQMTS